MQKCSPANLPDCLSACSFRFAPRAINSISIISINNNSGRHIVVIIIISTSSRHADEGKAMHSGQMIK